MKITSIICVTRGWRSGSSIIRAKTFWRMGLEGGQYFSMWRENLHYAVLDSTCWARTGVTGPSIAEEINSVLIKKGLVPFMASSKGRLEGANAFKQRLIGNEIEDGKYKPAIKFFSTCIHCLRTIPMIGHDKHKPELPDTDAEDHAYDAVAYGCMSRPWVPVRKKEGGDYWREKKIRRSPWTF